MSISTSPYLVRLQELKLWQGNYDSLLQKKRTHNTNTATVTDSSDLDSLDGVLAFDDSKSEKQNKHSGEENVEEWDKKVIVPMKKPFEELLDDKLSEVGLNQISSKPKKTFLKKGAGLARFNMSYNKRPRLKPKLSSPITNVPSTEKIETNFNEPTPLKTPEIKMDNKATWCKVDINNKETEVNEFLESDLVLTEVDSKDHPKGEYQTDSVYTQSQKELQLFERFEEKCEHSFSSINSSKVNQLYSTPKSNKQASNAPKDPTNLNMESWKMFFQNLISNKHVQDGSSQACISEQYVEKWSSSNSRAQSPSSFYTDFEDTLDGLQRTDAGVNTSFVDLSEHKQNQCTQCIQFKNQNNEQRKNELELRDEIIKYRNYIKQLETKRGELQKEIDYLKKRNEKDIEDLREELSNEKIKSAKEKALLDQYIKEMRMSKKERNENESLKQELTDLKELMKLKEAKNGTTQARLRNQVKQLEKEKCDLKSTIEKLQKENAKLNANQKINKVTDSKVLQEINRNLHKLTEENKRNNKTSDLEVENLRSQERCRRKSMGDMKVESEHFDLLVNKTENTSNNISHQYKQEDLVHNKKYANDLEKQYESAFGLQETKNSSQNVNVSDNTKETILLETELSDGSHLIKYTNGMKKTTSSDKKHIYIEYPNGDIKEKDFEKNIQKYYCNSKDIWITKFSDGTELIKFPNGQLEKKYPDGREEITTADGIILIKFPGGSQEINYPDSSKIVITSEEKIIYLPNGQKEIHTKDYKKREYPDGTIKIIYSNGTQESRYANGRVRMKDSCGNLISDSHASHT